MTRYRADLLSLAFLAGVLIVGAYLIRAMLP
jgi:hypothetical protein